MGGCFESQKQKVDDFRFSVQIPRVLGIIPRVLGIIPRGLGIITRPFGCPGFENFLKVYSLKVFFSPPRIRQ